MLTFDCFVYKDRGTGGQNNVTVPFAILVSTIMINRRRKCSVCASCERKEEQEQEEQDYEETGEGKKEYCFFVI